MHALARRAFAGFADGVVALIATSLILSPVVWFAQPTIWHVTNPVPLTWTLCVIGLSLVRGGNSIGKRWMGLQISGTGCLACREIRRMGWGILAGLAALLGFVLPDMAVLALRLFAAAFFVGAVLWPLLARADEFPHNRSTGFLITDTRQD